MSKNEPKYGWSVVKDLRYKPDSQHQRHTLDIYSPVSKASLEQEQQEKQEEPPELPVVVFVHGGGWMRGSKDTAWRGAPIVGSTCAKHGIIAVVVGYRLCKPAISNICGRVCLLSLVLSFLIWSALKLFLFYPSFGLVLSVIFPLPCLYALLAFSSRQDSLVDHHDQVSDVADAVSWVKENIKSHDERAYDKSIYLSGHSAGAHLASLVSLDTIYLENVGVPGDYIKGVIAISGIFSVSNPLSKSENSLKNKLFRFAYTNSVFPESERDTSSPVNHVTADAPPFLVMNAWWDMGLETDGEEFFEKLKSCGVPCEHVVIPGTSHSSISSKFHKHEAKEHFVDFIYKHHNGVSSSGSAVASQ